MRTYFRATLAAAIASSVAVAAVVAGAAALRKSAWATSHQVPIEDSWREPSTPTSPALVSHGRKLFLKNCAHCHGIDARGDEGPDLHDEEVSDRYIVRVITRGIPHEMPSFAKKLDGDDLGALTAYVRSLRDSAQTEGEKAD